MAFLACSRAIENYCSPVLSLGFTAGQPDSFMMHALATSMCLCKSRLATFYESSLFICNQPLTSAFAFPLVYWSKKYKHSLGLSTLDSMRTSNAAMNDGYDITSPENIGGLWLGERHPACCVTIILKVLPISSECQYSLDLVLYFLQGLNPFRKRTYILAYHRDKAWYQGELHCLLKFLLL